VKGKDRKSSQKVYLLRAMFTLLLYHMIAGMARKISNFYFLSELFPQLSKGKHFESQVLKVQSHLKFSWRYAEELVYILENPHRENVFRCKKGGSSYATVKTAYLRETSIAAASEDRRSGNYAG